MSDSVLTYQIIDHTEDLRIIVTGEDEKNLFIQAAQAMTDLMLKCLALLETLPLLHYS